MKAHTKIGKGPSFDGCAHEVSWDLVDRGDHDKEERALTKAKAISILDWLGARPRT